MQYSKTKNYKNPIIHLKLIKNNDILVVIDNETTIRYIDKNTLKTIDGFKAKIKHKSFRNDVVDYANDGISFGVVTEDEKESKLYNVKTRKAVSKVSRHKGGVSCVGIDPKNKYMFSCGNDGKIFVIDIKRSKMAFALPPHPDTINDIAFSQNAQWVATAGYDRRIMVYNIAMMSKKDILKAHSKPIMNLSFLPKNRLVSIDKDSSAIVWNIYESKIITRLQGIHDEVTKIITGENGRYLFIATKLGYILVYDMNNYELLSKDYIKLSSQITSLAFDDNTKELILGTIDGDIFIYYIYEGVEDIKKLLSTQDYDSAEEYVKKNPLLKNTEIYDLITNLWEKTLEKAVQYLQAQKKDIAVKLLSRFEKIPSKKSIINKILSEYEQYDKFVRFAKEGKFPLAYSLANQFPSFKDSKIYKLLEDKWRKDFKKAQELVLDPRKRDEVEQLLRPYRGIPEKTKDIQDMFQESNIYNKFLVELGKKSYKSAFEYIKRFPFLKNFPEYDALIQYGNKLHNKALEYLKQNDITKALKVLKILIDFDGYKDEVEAITKEVEAKIRFYNAVSKNDLSTAYSILDQYEELLETKDGQKLQNEWNESLEEASICASKGDVVCAKKALEKYMKIPSKYAALANIFAWAYMTQLEQALKMRYDRKKIEDGIKKYVLNFGINDQIETYFRFFKKYYPESKLNLESLKKGSFEMWRPSMLDDSVF